MITTSTRPSCTTTSRSTPRSAIVSTGISGSQTSRLRQAAPAPAMRLRPPAPCSPGRPGVGALHMLHHAEQVPEVLAVPAGASAGLHPLVGRPGQRGPGQHRICRFIPRIAQRCRVDCDARRNKRCARRRRTRTSHPCSPRAGPPPPGRARGSPRCRRRAGSPTRWNGAGDRRSPFSDFAAMAARVASSLDIIARQYASANAE